MTAILNITRRDILSGGAATGLVLGFHMGSKFASADAATDQTFAPNVYVAIDESGLVTIIAHRSEMGTGIRTDLPMVLADELEADWTRVKIVQAQGDAKYGDQNTDGSRSTWQFYQPMREAGAVARQMLEAAAAQVWHVKTADCHAMHLAAASHRISADYFVPYYAHAPMEVPAAVARFDGGTCEIFAPTQDPQGARKTVAEVLNLPEADVSAFGRKSKPDFIAEAAVLARQIGAPVKVTWTREDEIRNDYYHAICAQHLEAGLEGSRVTAWLHRTVFPPIDATFKPDITYGSVGNLQQGVTDMPFAIANVRCENGPAASHVRIGWYRSVYNIPHAFAVCSFADELAAAAGKDPIEYLRQLLGDPRKLDFKALNVEYPNYGASLDLYPVDTGRLRGVLDLVAQNSEWGQPLPRHGRGVAVHRSFLTHVAAVAHVAVAADGQITIPRVDVAVDCGLVVNPDRVRAQFEGATIMGIGNTLYSNITIKEGRIEQGNFADYLVARTDITPDTRVHIVKSNAPPGGVGEPGVPPIAPAICNAIFAATGKRIRALPVDPAELKAA